VPLAALFLSCGGGGGSSSGGGTSSETSGTGSVAVLLADGPADAYDHIYIWVTEVSLIPAAGSAAPVTIFQTNKVEAGNTYPGHKVDLLQLQDEDFILTVKNDVPAGKYAKIRLEISHIEAVGTDVPCNDMEIKLPSGKIDLDPQDGPFLLAQGTTLSIRLDIDANKSINLHPAGKSGKCIFRPVVFVDIEEGAPLDRCPKIVSGTIDSLRYNDTNQVVGFVLDLQGDRGTLEVNLSDTTSIFNDNLLCMTPGDLDQYQNAQVKVRGRLNKNGVFEASLVVIGELLDVTGTVTKVPGDKPAAVSFNFQPSPKQELGGVWPVTGQTCTLVLVGCDTIVDPSKIQQGMPVCIFGKAFSTGELRAAAVVLRDREVSGTILSVEDEPNGKTITIDENGSSVQVFVGTTTPIHLEGDGTVGLDQLCADQKVRVLLKSLAAPFEAALVQVESVRHAGVVSKVVGPGVLEVALTEGGSGIGTETVYVQTGATILKSTEGSGKQELLTFAQINVGDSIVYFGLPVCQDSSKFNASVVVIVGGQ
jgi:Domain of unknown function (DUF4382)